ncbi:MAG: hypothetical protein F4X98_17600, partial [Gammaproteobacteria bacterium]|nr:hypothetical protein [Gammaproteobacteria bacterium]
CHTRRPRPRGRPRPPPPPPGPPRGAGRPPPPTAVGQLIAERATAAGIDTVAFDRSGYKYHGRVKALADAARAGGLKF